MNVLIESNTERRLWALIRAVDTEIGGWGYARLDGCSLTWDTVFLVPQEVSHSEVDFEDTGGDDAAIERAIHDGVLQDPGFVWVSWHSHHSMKPFWSKTDDARIAAIAQTGVKRLLSFVGCHNGTYTMRLDVFDVNAHDISLGQVSLADLKLVSDTDDEFTASIAQEIAANVKVIKAQPLSGIGWTSIPGLSEEDLSIAEAFAVKDLMDHDFSREQALRVLEEVGVDGVDELIDRGDRSGHHETIPLEGVS